jgi:hypothetical protein
MADYNNYSAHTRDNNALLSACSTNGIGNAACLLCGNCNKGGKVIKNEEDIKKQQGKTGKEKNDSVL